MGMSDGPTPPDYSDPPDVLYRFATYLRTLSHVSDGVADQVDRIATGIDEVHGKALDVSQTLPGGAGLTMMMHPWGEHRWKFDYRYVKYDTENFRKVRVLCDWSCIVDYKQGILQPEIDITMHVIVPERAGKEVVYGLDISPGYKTYFEFKYRRLGDVFRLMEVRQAEKRIDLTEMWAAVDKGDKTPVKPFEIPWPIVVHDTIQQQYAETAEDGTVRRYGDFELTFPVNTDDPFMETEHTVAHVHFPMDLRRNPA